MKKLYFLFFLTIGFLANAQIVNIPDANFKAKLLSASPSNTIASTQTPDDFGQVTTYHTIDTNGDGEIQVTEAQAIKFLKVHFSNINNLTGIEAFVNLESFDCNYNQLTNLNVPNLINLRRFFCAGNQLTTLDVTSLSNLSFLDCYTNQLTNLNVSGLTNLESIWCFNNQLTNLNISNLTNLKHVRCENNQLVNLEFTNSTNLITLWCFNNQLPSLDLTQSINLNTLNCSSNQLTSLNVIQNSSLEFLTCNNNPLATIDVTNNPVLRSLNCSNSPSLQTLFIKNGNLTPWSTLNFSGNPNLEFVCCDDGDLTLVQQRILDYGYTNCNATNLNCDFTVSFEVSGNVRYDYFNDGCDINDVFVPNVKYEIFDGTETVITSGNQLGNYYIPLQLGSYTITPIIENPNYFNVSPANFSVDFPSNASPFQQNICLTWNELENYDDLEVVIIPTTPARPGFEAKYKVIVRNKGFNETFGSVSLTYDNSILTYLSSIPVFNSSTSNTITWNFYCIPFQTLEFDVVFNLNSPSDSPVVNIGDELNFTAVVTHDEWIEYTPNDNTFTLNQTVVGSYDPNDKVCLQGETEDVSIVGEYVHYMIRFENTGTFLAEKVVVEDFIDITKFDVSTLIPLHASHSYYTKITGNKVEFIFDNINLDFNAPNNGGFISFKIKLLPTLTIGDTFSNYVNIYFDFNPPIVTDTYTTTIVALSSTSFDFNNHFVLYPNPAKETVSVQSKDGIGINSIEIYNNIGQMILSTTNASNTIAISNLASGIYFVKVNTDKGTANTKFIKE